MASQNATAVSRDGQQRILPPLFDEKGFDQVLDSISDHIGSEHVSRDASHGNLEGPQDQRSYGDIWPMGDYDEHAPSAAIRPASVEELQAVLKIANQHKLPLWTVSRGRNLGYGASGPVVKGTVVIDLHRMNKIIEVNEKYAYAIVEPGVSFSDLYEYIQEKGYDLWPSVPALGWGSVVGNTLERGFGYTPYGEHSQHQCGMEVVLADGQIVRSGMGAMRDSPMWPLFKGGYGPAIDGLFYQSNLGIVTKIGIHLMPAPPHFIDCEVSVPKEEDLMFLVKITAQLEREAVIQNHTSISNIYRQAVNGKDMEALRIVTSPGQKGGCFSEAELLDLQKDKGWGYWKGAFSIYGASAEVVNAQWAVVQERFTQVPGAKFNALTYSGKGGRPIKASEMPLLEIPHNGYPQLAALSLSNYRGHGGGHVAFSPLFPPGAPEMQQWYRAARRLIEAANFDLFADFHVYGRYVIAIILVVYGPNEGGRATQMFEDLLKDAKDVFRIAEYRTHISYMDDVRRCFDFGDGALGRLVTRLKDELDPNGILSQGKSGIWSNRKDQ